ncbi:hypothetical protein KSP39_PZI016201 [Platanthera zijinensis]|uniref:Uncharacterized protein n=1 Tax=Platanthera zijinensis TaxID=2320716 RepID=A0AAP0B771_9ASPA
MTIDCLGANQQAWTFLQFGRSKYGQVDQWPLAQRGSFGLTSHNYSCWRSTLGGYWRSEGRVDVSAWRGDLDYLVKMVRCRGSELNGDYNLAHSNHPLKSLEQEYDTLVDSGETTFTLFASLLESTLQELVFLPANHIISISSKLVVDDLILRRCQHQSKISSCAPFLSRLLLPFFHDLQTVTAHPDPDLAHARSFRSSSIHLLQFLLFQALSHLRDENA